MLWPAGLCVGTWLVGRLASRTAKAADAGAAVGVAVAFCGAQVAAHGWPGFPIAASDDAWKWVFWFAAAGAAVGLLRSRVRVPEDVRIVGCFALGAVAAWLLLRSLVPHAIPEGKAIERAATAGLLAMALWTALGVGARRGGGLASALPLLVPLLAASAILFLQGASIVFGQAAGALAVAATATALLARWRGGRAVPEGAVPVLALTFFGLVFGAHTLLNYGDVVRFPLTTALLLVAAAACFAIPRIALATGLSAVLTAAAAILADRLAT